MANTFLVNFELNGKTLQMTKDALLKVFPEVLSNHMLSIKGVHTATITSEKYGTIIITREN